MNKINNIKETISLSQNHTATISNSDKTEIPELIFSIPDENEIPTEFNEENDGIFSKYFETPANNNNNSSKKITLFNFNNQNSPLKNTTIIK